MPQKTRQGAGHREDGWSLKDIQKLIDLVVDRQLSEFEMERDGLRVRIRRGESQAATSPPAQTVLPVTLATGAAGLPSTSAITAASAPAESEPPSEPSSSDSIEGLYI